MRRVKRIMMVALASIVAVSGLAIVPNKVDARSLPAAEDCVNVKDVANHAWNGETVFLSIPGKKQLCEPLYVVGAAFRYVDPEPGDGRSGKWPQALAGTSNITTIYGPGTYIITTPAICGQRDVYAQLGSAPVVPETMKMYGDNEPTHLHRFSQGLVTYSSDDPSTCDANGQTITPEQAEREQRKNTAEYRDKKEKKERKEHREHADRYGWHGRREKR